jgi:Family of unknown function (DUF6786)
MLRKMKTLARLSTAGLCASLLAAPAAAQTFADEVAFLQKHTKVVVLTDGKGMRVAVAPDLQGRVMTSSARGEAGPAYGWINRDLLSSSTRDVHFNPYGGEDRFWLGPEGGQYAVFFKAGEPFDLAHWYTPAAVDTEPYPVMSSAPDRVTFDKKMTLTNRAGTVFDLALHRVVRLVPRAQALKDLDLTGTEAVQAVAFESENRITNTGTQPWRKDGGLVSVWILGMFKPSPQTTIVVPFTPGPEATLGPIVNAAYFGQVPPARLAVGERAVFFSGDGRFRSKIGLSPARVRPVLGSYDASGGVLTLVQFDRPADARDYVNSMWEIQKEPFAGDVVNSYNDGPSAPGAKPLGPFYELETSSPAAALPAGGSLVHRHRTIHVTGDRAALDTIARKALGVSLDAITSALAGAASSN